ncbi:hypothetical protein DXG01_016146 [Tephrocybe rancida]|nr:hypothetical protein DXG01_016146 [Tephrocybe rancida]
MYFHDQNLPKNRLPSSRHEGLNGFTLPFLPPLDPLSEPSTSALDAHRAAQYVLTQKDRAVPSLKEMQEALKPDTKESLTKRIEDLQAQHAEDLDRMYTWHAAEYLQDARDLYMSVDDAFYPPPPSDSAEDTQDEITKFYTHHRLSLPSQTRWSSDLEHLRYSYLKLLLPLHASLRSLEQREAEEKKRQEADFPFSIDDFRSKSEDVKARVARFLMASNDPALQEKMLRRVQVGDCAADDGV